MWILLIGLVIFLGVHSVRIVADHWRTAQIARVGEKPWKIGYSVLSLIGFLILVLGYGIARNAPGLVWQPPTAMRHVAGLLTLIAFVLLAAAYVPRNGVKSRLHHPMVLGVMVWAFAHLLANGTPADMILFGSFLVWSIFSFSAARQRDRMAGATYPSGTAAGTLTAIAAGAIGWALFAFWLHGLLIGVRPFG